MAIHAEWAGHAFHKEKEGETILVVEVSDNGIGIHEELLAKLNTMQQIQSSKGTEGEKGTGLGLMLCRELIEKNNGILEIVSIKNEGTTIIVQVPLLQNIDN